MLSNVETNLNKFQNTGEQTIRGKAVVIVGDMSGTGYATASLLAEQGAKVFIAAKNDADLKQTAAEVKSVGVIDGAAVDLSKPAEVRRFFQLAKSKLGRIDVLVDCLAIEPDLPVDAEAIRNLCTQEAIAQMQGQRKGQIINIGSPTSSSFDPASMIPVTGRQVSGPSPRQLAAALRKQAKSAGIRVTRIEPGMTVFRDPSSAVKTLGIEDVARCIFDSLIQPFGVDVIFMHGRFND